ncbi:uncharacterized protein N7482_000656 [Penicillium canariense]|uniref:F-box domain-containing protein n=1 Tax=Penicillium canariense TaxID=189055 RepID=A0A9W9IEJ8_9EURO|nr:uncharacterized protein N7482_000656 [Penicillium canariense]KAJ5174779.1 hypothetical protein N7482_000656 [Penicillium canariense]
MASSGTIPLPPATQADDLPEPTTVTISGVPKFSLTSNITIWGYRVKNSLKPLMLGNLIDPSKPRPASPRPILLRWRFWSLTVREWLFDQLDDQIIDLINNLPAEPTYADDLWREINKLQLGDPEEYANKATCDLFTMRRSDFTTAAEYIEAWQYQNGICTGLKVGVTPYMSTVFMFNQLEEELPRTVGFLHGQLAMKAGDAVNMDKREFIDLCNKLLIKARALPIHHGNDALVKKSTNRTKNKNKSKKDPKHLLNQNPKGDVAKKQIRRVPPKGKDHAAYAREWRQHNPQRDEDDKCSYCNQPNHGCATCSYLIEHKPSGWTPYPLLWCFNYQSLKSTLGPSRRTRNRTPEERMESRHIWSKDRSMLLQLPGDIRNQIYTCLFASTRLTFGERRITRITRKTMNPAPNSLAILRTCRQVKQEAEALWLGLVLFSFETPESMLDKLSPLPLTTLSEIRHVRVGGRSLMLQPIDDDGGVYYRLVWVLKLLPGLRLDKLTILGPPSSAVAYDTLGGLIEYGNGWRELHFITPNSKMLGFANINMYMVDPYLREPQPSTWSDILSSRDGANSGASVTIFRSTQSDSPGSVINPRTRQPFEQKLITPNQADFGMTEDRDLLSGSEASKELLVVVKRGRHAHIEEQDSPPFMFEDIRDWAHGMTWAEIRRLCYDVFPGDEDENDLDVETDRCGVADEYSWDLFD